MAGASCVKERPPAPDVQKRLLLAGKAGVGQVLGGGAAANGGCRIGQAQPFAQLLIGGAYPVGDGGRKCAVEKAAADRPASLRKAGLSRTIGLQMAANIGRQTIGRNELAIGGRSEERRVGKECVSTCRARGSR